MSISKKKFFRHLRGELNGYYLQSVSYFINNWTDDNYNKLFAYFKNMQFRMDSANELENISSEDLRNLAKFAGVTQLLTRKTLATNLLRMTNSHELNGIEYSERGLWDRENEIFKFFHIIQDFTSDILDWASVNQRMSLVPHDRTVLGYLYYGEQHYDSSGNFIESSVHEFPPLDSTPYIEYFGQMFMVMFHSDADSSEEQAVYDNWLLADGGTPLGYIYGESLLWDENGDIDTSQIHENPPEDSTVPYTEWYGQNYAIFYAYGYANRNAHDYMLMTESHISENGQYSERGLLDMATRIFTFYNIASDYSDDIVDVATSDLQMSMVPEGQAVLGYIAEGTVMYDTDGVFHPERLLSEPPATGAYVEYYGDKFLQLGENYIVSSNAPDRLIYEMLVLIQKIHYQGASVKTFAEMTNILVGDFVKLGSQTRHTRYVEWSYVNDETVETTNRTIKLTLWRSLVEQFFQQIVLTEAGA